MIGVACRTAAGSGQRMRTSMRRTACRTTSCCITTTTSSSTKEYATTFSQLPLMRPESTSIRASMPWMPIRRGEERPSLLLSTRRWMNSSSGKDVDSKTKSSKQTTTTEKEAQTKLEQEDPLTSFDPKAHLDRQLINPMVSRMEKRIKKVVDDLNPGDQLSVIAIACLFIGIFTAPYTIPKMKQSNNTYDELATEDPVDDFAKLARQEWGVVEEGKSAIEVMLRDLMQSKALQEASKEFVLRLLESPEVKQGLNRLIKELWTDLVSDPETVRQVVHLLNIAIQDEKVKKAAQKLVIELVDQPEVKRSLVLLVEGLGKDDSVVLATQDLLTKSAHRSLNDPEILEHTMEFASDIVGDDIVQQSARDALWNTVGHAMRPVTAVVLTTAGVGLILFGVVSIAYSRSSEQEVKLFESALSSLISNASLGIARMVSWPFRFMGSLSTQVTSVIVYPFQAAHRGIDAAISAVHGWFLQLLAAPGYALNSLWAMIVSTAQHVYKKALEKATRAHNSTVELLSSTYSRLVDSVLSTIAKLSTDLQRICWSTGMRAFRSTEALWMKALYKLAELEERIVLSLDRVLGR